MRGTEFGELSAFLVVAEQRNFTRAAKQLGISPATLSQTIRSLEERLGLRLLNRTTRSVATTEAGEQLLQRLRPVINDYEAVIDSLNDFRDKPAGLLRLTVTPPAAKTVLAPLLAKFLAQYPDIRLEISVDSANIDIVAQQFDAGIRVVNQRRSRHDSGQDHRRVADRHGRGAILSRAARLRPKSPEELQAHNCIRLRLQSGAMLPWRFQKNGKGFDVSVTGSLILNETSLMEPAPRRRGRNGTITARLCRHRDCGRPRRLAARGMAALGHRFRALLPEPAANAGGTASPHRFSA